MMSTALEELSPLVSNHDRYRGQIQIIFGPMFSGKTTELLRRMKRFMFANSKCLLVKYSKDDRYDKDGVATHDKQVLPAVSATSLLNLCAQAFDCEVIGIDEGQFFPDIVEFCDKMAELGKTVIVAALDGTFQKVGFGNILNLVPLAESVVKLTAVCMKCYQDASFTKRIGQETEVEVIGGADKYLAVCRACFLTPTKNKEENKENTPILSESTMNKKHSRKLFASSNSHNIMSS